MADTAIVAFARHPTPGKVKTRLAKDTGNDAATHFYKVCAEHVIAQVSRCEGCTCYLFFSLAQEEGLVKAWLAPLGQDLQFLPQLQSTVLGDRMYDAMASRLAQGHSKVIIVGTDVPDLSTSLIRQTIAALDQYQLVFGPAEDGGYYLMGATTMPPAIFEGIEWSTSTVLASNLANAARLGLQVAPLGTLPRLADIDTAEDLERWLLARGRGEEGRQQDGQQGEQAPEALLGAAAAALTARAERQRQQTER